MSSTIPIISNNFEIRQLPPRDKSKELLPLAEYWDTKEDVTGVMGSALTDITYTLYKSYVSWGGDGFQRATDRYDLQWNKGERAASLRRKPSFLTLNHVVRWIEPLPDRCVLEGGVLVDNQDGKLRFPNGITISNYGDVANFSSN